MSPPRTGRELIGATRSFASENPWLSRSHALLALAAIAVTCAVTMQLTWWPLRLVAAVLQGLLLVRGFILYHDAMHGALLRNSALARGLFYAYGVLVLTPPSVWRQTHNYHHAHTAKIVGSHVGSYPMLTTDLYRRATPVQRLLYRATRHPLNVLFGYVTIFLLGMCLSPLIRAPRKHWDAGLALAAHAILSVVVWRLFGFDSYVFAVLVPIATACAAGAYLFYAQHNFPDVAVQPRETWEYSRAALESSSFMRLGPVMNWFTGNIGYHHVHHLNPSIPFYRLPEAMAALPELQHPRVTTLSPRDVAACFRLKLWDPAQQRMVGYEAAERS